VNLSKCEKVPYFYIKVKKHLIVTFIILGNYSWVENANLKIPLFMIASDTILIEHEIFDSEKGTTKVVMSKL